MDLTIDKIATIIITAIVLIIIRMKRKFQYWKTRKVPQLEVPFPLGNAPNPFKIKKPFFLKVMEFYKKFKEAGHKHGGIYMMTRPVYMVIHPDYVKHVMSVDFKSFHDRGTYYNEKADPLSGHLFNLEGKKWENLRKKLTPTFTTGKLKTMFSTLLDCGKQMQDEIEKLSLENDPVDIKEVLKCYSIDVIGSVAFGVDCNSFKDPDAEFRRYATMIFKPSLRRKARIFMSTTFPTICRLFGIVFTPKEVRTFFLNLVRNVIEHRQKNRTERNDFMQILINLKNQEGGMSVEEIAAQAFVFFIAGFETSATTINFCLFELAQNQTIQDRVRDEIERILRNHNEEVTYDAVAEHKYLDQVVDETLRKYPPVPHLSRKCTKDYSMPDADLVLEKNGKVFISVLGLHKDPEFYPEPEKFDPERFSEENKSTRHPFTFIPFGEGPRNCIGSRFGVMQTKVGLILLLKNFKVTLSKKTELPLMLEPTALLMTTKNKIWLEFKKLID